jgi:3-oxoadipate enol-lactonase
MEGPPGSPALVLLHGWMATAALNWYGSLEFLGRSFSVVAPNLRGHGRQGRGAPPFSVEACADDLAALINELSLGRAIVVGYSMGGAIAQMLARRHRDAVHGVVLCATAASFARRLKLRPAVRVVGRLSAAAARRWPDTAQHFLDWRIARHDRIVERRRHSDSKQLFGSGAEVLHAVGEGLTKGVIGDEPMAGAPTFAREIMEGRPEWAFQERTMSDLAAFIEAGAELNAYDSSSWLPELEIPAAVLVTARDEVVAPWRQEAMAALIPGARRYLVDAGHDAVVAKPDIFLPVLRDACAELAKAKL